MDIKHESWWEKKKKSSSIIRVASSDPAAQKSKLKFDSRSFIVSAIAMLTFVEY